MSKWMQTAFAEHKGALHRDLGVPLDEKIPRALLFEAARHPERFKSRPDHQRRLARRAWAAINAGRKRR